jgi:hypothetical protein
MVLMPLREKSEEIDQHRPDDSVHTIAYFA